VPKKSKRKTGATTEVRMTVMVRAGFRCERCGVSIQSIPMSIHHRRPRAMGGTTREETNYPSNLMALCGSGTTGCHGHLESNRNEAFDFGFIVPQFQMPNNVPVKTYLQGWVLLNNDGTLTTTLEPSKGDSNGR
jgi:hypothetical protein